jgi:hypothetical protein
VQGKRKKKSNLNNKQAVEKKNRHVAKRVGGPELQRVGKGQCLM